MAKRPGQSRKQLNGQVEDWTELERRDTVTLTGPRAASKQTTGTVDDIAADSSIIWLLPHDGSGRRLFHINDGYTTLVHAVHEASR